MSHERFQSCIDACISCAIACEHCATECIKEDDIKMWSTVLNCRVNVPQYVGWGMVARLDGLQGVELEK